MEESPQTSGRSTTSESRSDHVAKPGGKADGKRKAKRAEKEKDGKARVRPSAGKRAAATSKASSKAPSKAKPKWAKGSQRLVEQVAEEILLAEFGRAVGE